jgi:hypothetical protein
LTNSFPYRLPDELGEIVRAQEECPGVYYVSLQSNDRYTEYYVVLVDAGAISQQAKSYGQEIPGNLLLYNLEVPGSGRSIIDYEIRRYQVRNSIPVEQGDTLLTLARYGAEDHPEYFGAIPPPLETPWGCMTRHRKLTDGVFWLETDQGRECLAVCGTLWEQALSDFTRRLAQDWERTQDYQFYDQVACCLPFFELGRDHKDIRRWYDRPALMNAIWRDYPEYAAAWNLREVSGLNDAAGLFLRSLGVEAELRVTAEDAIQLSGEGECEFLRIEEAVGKSPPN